MSALLQKLLSPFLIVFTFVSSLFCFNGAVDDEGNIYTPPKAN